MLNRWLKSSLKFTIFLGFSQNERSTFLWSVSYGVSRVGWKLSLHYADGFWVKAKQVARTPRIVQVARPWDSDPSTASDLGFQCIFCNSVKSEGLRLNFRISFCMTKKWTKVVNSSWKVHNNDCFSHTWLCFQTPQDIEKQAELACRKVLQIWIFKEMKWFAFSETWRWVITGAHQQGNSRELIILENLNFDETIPHWQ